MVVAADVIGGGHAPADVNSVVAPNMIGHGHCGGPLTNHKTLPSEIRQCFEKRTAITKN